MAEPSQGDAKLWGPLAAPSLDDIEALAIEALEALPEPFRSMSRGVECRVAEFPTEEICKDMDLESPFDLMGLFEGIGMTDDGIIPQTGQMPNRVWLYRRPILDYWAEHTDTLGEIVTHVLVHEIGHHFGLSDDDMYAIDDGLR
ncbi:metallopeptidase family protein [Pelagibacterium halotolerans]|uniref:Acetylglutamate kinase n=1 Tax=Pelagibacterium halotolerans (strain DSM 22347 / JCM 15775 / CGMCC 1.7692 / B2) TaxID=1082931 RepID=G4R6W8_PELHB|nr:metallopeptidase family protein [Pelagibacterium halotolerans]AEQ53241.1 acetylglutamate kinase [Pelagibacterium halotolerans B2]QJR20425.1 Zn-dependent protease [Pelagibacterium halotolerans]SEA96450.1 Predicted Zn-dependent protease, minimal metalloprotease (MMP)-like domain [Pelagibacterium halotolerans]